MNDEELPAGTVSSRPPGGRGEPPPEARDRHAALATELDEHQYRYYVLDAPTIGDGEYDAAHARAGGAGGAVPGAAYAGLADQRVGGAYSTAFAPVAARRADDEPGQRVQPTRSSPPGPSGSSARSARRRRPTCAS